MTVLLDSDAEGDGQVAELKKGYRDEKLLDDDFNVQVGDLDHSSLDVSVTSVQEIEDLTPTEIIAMAIRPHKPLIEVMKHTPKFAAFKLETVQHRSAHFVPVAGEQLHRSAARRKGRRESMTSLAAQVTVSGTRRT